MKSIIFGVVGGLGLFIFGMKYLSDGLQKIGSRKVRRMMRFLTGNRIKGVVTGALVTSVIQSSSATTVILIGLLNAGIINLVQSASVVIGSNIGTTITAQIIAFKISKYALPGIAIGVLMMFIGKRKKIQFWGQVIFALGIIFLGLSTISGVVKPLKDFPIVTEFFIKLSFTPILAILLGTIFTVTIQSSSAAIGVLLAIAMGGLIDFKAALYILLGTNIGTTITAWLASIGGTRAAKRMALFHSIFNILGSVYFAFLIYIGIYEKFIDWVTIGEINSGTIARNIANAHTFFNIFNAIVFLPLIAIIIKFIKRVIPGEDVFIPTELKYLQDHLLDTPSLAIDSARKEIADMTKMAKKVFNTSYEGLLKNDSKSIDYVNSQEDAIDNIQHDITTYLAKISTETLTLELSQQLPTLLHSVNDIERVSDHAVNIAKLTDRIISNNIKFSQSEHKEIDFIYKNIIEMFDYAIDAVSNNSSKPAKKILEIEEVINKSRMDFLNKYNERLITNKVSASKTLVSVDLINNFEKVGDHLSNVAQAALGHFYYK